MYSKKSPLTLALIGLLFSVALFITGCDESSIDTAAVEAPESETSEAAPSPQPAEVISEIVAPAPTVEVSEEATQSETIEAAPSIESAEVVSEVAIPAPVVEVSQNELIEIVGYLTAQGGGVASLQLDEASVNALAEGLRKSLNGEINIMTVSYTHLRAHET